MALDALRTALDGECSGGGRDLPQRLRLPSSCMFCSSVVAFGVLVRGKSCDVC